MKHILSPSGRAALEALARHQALIAFDYDGTLAPLVDDPAQAFPRATTQRLMAELTRLYPCALITGRSLADVERFLAGARFRTIVGNHGAEASWLRDRSRRTGPWIEALAGKLPPEVRVEDKGYSLSLHYRGVDDPDAMHRHLLEVAGKLADVRLLGGKCVLNVIPSGAPTKGDALCTIWEQVGAETVLYVGDDETDEDVFAAAYADTIVGVRVEPDDESRAGYFLRGQEEIDQLLDGLISLRRKIG